MTMSTDADTQHLGHDGEDEVFTPKFPHVEVQLTGLDGNAFMVLGAVTRALRKNGLAEHAEAFIEEATDGDYDHLLQTAMRWVDIT